MKCPRCGTENRALVLFCRHCGQKLVNEKSQTPPSTLSKGLTASANVVCSVCGTAVKASARFCPRCGNELQISHPSPEFQQQTIQPAISNTNQLSSTGIPGPSTAHSPSYAQPMESAQPSLVTRHKIQEVTYPQKKQTIVRGQKSSPGKIWGVIIGIILLIVILVALSTIFIPKALQGTGLFQTHTATPEVLAQPSITLTPTFSASPTTEPRSTIEPTIEPAPVSVLPAASLILSTTPETITVDSQVIVTASLTNDGEVSIIPIRCDLLGALAPSLQPAEGVTYTLNLGNIEPPIIPGTTTTFIYLLDAVEAGMVSLSAGALIEVGATDNRQMIVSPVFPLRIHQLTEP